MTTVEMAAELARLQADERLDLVFHGQDLDPLFPVLGITPWSSFAATGPSGKGKKSFPLNPEGNLNRPRSSGSRQPAAGEMTMTTQTTTLRSQAREAIQEELTAAARKDHEGNYEKLHVNHDGSVSWFESIDKYSDLIDAEADGCQPIQSVITVGTGSYACNCDYCDAVYNAEAEADAIEAGRPYDRDAKYEKYEDAIADAVGNSDLEEMERMMLEAFDAIPVGYFDDEQDDE